MKTLSLITSLFFLQTAMSTPVGSTSGLVLDERATNDTSLDKRCDFSDGYGPVPCDHFSVIVRWDGYVSMRGDGWSTSQQLNCGGDQWLDITSPLPWIVRVHGGNACTGSGFDNTWIAYANQWLDTPSDTRCGPVCSENSCRRCLIFVNP